MVSARCKREGRTVCGNGVVVCWAGDHSDIPVRPDDDHAVVAGAVAFAELARRVHDGSPRGSASIGEDEGHGAEVAKSPAEFIGGRMILAAEQNDVPRALKQIADKGDGAVGMGQPGYLC